MKNTKKSKRRRPVVVVDQMEVFQLKFDPLALPIMRTPSNTLPSCGCFIRDPEISTLEEEHNAEMDSLMRRAGIC